MSCAHAVRGFSWVQAMVFESYYCFVPTWLRDRLYQHNLDCVILAWASCPFPALRLHVLPRPTGSRLELDL